MPTPPSVPSASAAASRRQAGGPSIAFVGAPHALLGGGDCVVERALPLVVGWQGAHAAALQALAFGLQRLAALIACAAGLGQHAFGLLHLLHGSVDCTDGRGTRQRLAAGASRLRLRRRCRAGKRLHPVALARLDGLQNLRTSGHLVGELNAPVGQLHLVDDARLGPGARSGGK